MALMNSETGWGWPARVLHWVMAVLILGLIGVGVYMSNFERDLIAEYKLAQAHKSVGFVVFVLALGRLAWRRANRATPALPETMPRWQRRAARASHIALYVLMVAMPLSGWLMASASPFNDPGAFPFQIKNEVFGLFELPDPFPVGSEPLRKALLGVHIALAASLVLVLILHAGAALKHHFVDRDSVLRRMIRG